MKTMLLAAAVLGLGMGPAFAYGTDYDAPYVVVPQSSTPYTSYQPPPQTDYVYTYSTPTTTQYTTTTTTTVVAPPTVYYPAIPVWIDGGGTTGG